MSGPCLSSSVAGHPLRPATRHRLGEPLPHQLTNRTRAHPQAHCCFNLAILCGINPSFPGLSRSRGQVTHVLLTRAPLENYYQASNSLVRLACLIHAASVRSEPESNSPSNIIFEIAGPNGIFRFHLRHASVSSSLKLCLLRSSSLCQARRASRPFFFPLASTNPPLSELGRSFGFFLPRTSSRRIQENPRRVR